MSAPHKTYKAKVETYTARLRNPTEDYSRVLPHVPANVLAAVGAPLLDARLHMAEARVRLDLRGELMRSGVGVSEEQLSILINAIPRDDYFRLIAARV